jgi:UDP-GlcNAc:undecaprenyl-phosphate GlcNAc-1-phosphate transferase
VQAAVAATLVYGGVGHGVSSNLLAPLREWLPDWLFGARVSAGLSWFICAFVIAGATNSTNLIDGLDGLCAGVVAIASLGFLAMGLYMFRAGTPAGGDATLRMALCVGLLGGCLGFLAYNFHPARIFMGDSGSLLLGFSAALALILFAQYPTWKWLAGAALVFGFPIFDTALAITRRALNGRPLFVGDRSHFYDQLRDRGLSVRKTVLLCYLISLILAVLGSVLVTLPTGYSLTVLILSPILALLLCRRLGMLRVDAAGRRAPG